MGLVVILFVAWLLAMPPRSGAAAKSIVNGVRATPTSFYRGTDSTVSKHSTRVTYFTRVPAKVSVVVRNASGNRVRTLRTSRMQPKGRHRLVWNGRDDGRSLVRAGTYSVVVRARAGSTRSKRTAKISVLASPIRRVSASPPVIYADNGSSVLRYRLSTKATVSIVVKDVSSQAAVRTLRSSRTQSAGAYAFTWDGKGSGGASLPAGDYAFVISATTARGTVRESRLVEVMAPVLGSVSATPGAFSANGGLTTFTYTIIGAATTSVVVIDDSGDTVRTLRAGVSQAAGSYSLTWDGTADSGLEVPAGSYTLVASATTPIGTVRRSATVQVEEPVLGTANVSPASFYGGAGASGATTLTYTLTRPADVSVTVRDGNGAKVATIQSPAALASGAYSTGWSGVNDSGASLRAGTYTLIVEASTAAGKESASLDVHYAPTPVANEAALALNGSGAYVLHTVIENWDETLNGQTPADYYYDGEAQPWEYAATAASAVTLYVGTNPVDPRDVTAGGSVIGVTDASGVKDLAFPALTWSSPMYYSLEVSYGGSSRWYPVVGRYQVRPPTDANGHVRFAFMSDVQTSLEADPVPNQQPKDMAGPYSAIPNLSLSRGWSKVLSGLKSETGTNLVLFGGDCVQRAGDATAPDDGSTQWRQLLDSEQGFSGADEWSLSSLASTMPVQLSIGNHDDLGVGDAATAVTNRLLNNRWLYRPAQDDSDRGYYTFDQGDIHFVVMNPYLTTASRQYSGWIGLQSLTAGGSRFGIYAPSTAYTNSRQGDWLIDALETSKPWTVVVAHTPVFDAQNSAPWSQVNQTGAATSSNDIYFGERDRMLQLFAAKGVDLVLQGHLHMFRRHVEKVRSASGETTSAMTFLTDGLAGAAPIGATESGYGAWIDWIDQTPINGRYDVGEPLATPTDTHYDASYFGTPNNARTTASGYTVGSDMFHAIGEYPDALTFSYTIFQTGTDGSGAPTLTMEVKTVSWNATTHLWDPWAVYESAAIPLVGPGMVAQRFDP